MIRTPDNFRARSYGTWPRAQEVGLQSVMVEMIAKVVDERDRERKRKRKERKEKKKKKRKKSM